MQEHSMFSEMLIILYLHPIAGMWQHTLDMVDTYYNTYGAINIISGPIYDLNLDGHRDDPSYVWYCWIQAQYLKLIFNDVLSNFCYSCMYMYMCIVFVVWKINILHVYNCTCQNEVQ